MPKDKKKRKSSSINEDEKKIDQFPADSDLESSLPAPPSKKKKKLDENKDSETHVVDIESTNKDESSEKEAMENGNQEEKVELQEEDRQEISDILDEIAIRKQKKREKRALRRLNPPTPQTNPSALQTEAYLKAWSTDRSNWKWKSARERWLIKNWLDRKLVSDSMFEIVVPYFVSMRGGRRDVLRKTAKRLTKEIKKNHPDDFKEFVKGPTSEAARYLRAKALRKALKQPVPEEINPEIKK